MGREKTKKNEKKNLCRAILHRRNGSMKPGRLFTALGGFDKAVTVVLGCFNNLFILDLSDIRLLFHGKPKVRYKTVEAYYGGKTGFNRLSSGTAQQNLGFTFMVVR